MLGAYLDGGGNYIETAASYGDGEAERKIGNTIMHRRDEFVLVTKTNERTKAASKAQIEQSLKNLKTDHVDCLLMHAVPSIEELDIIMGEGGAMEAALEMKRAGYVKHIGISMHGWPYALIEGLNRGGFEAVMSTMNYYDRFNYPEIEEQLLPLAQEKGAGVILMKPVADGYLYRSADEAFRYAFSLPVSVVVTGMNNRKMLDEDMRRAETFTPMREDEKQELYNNALELGNYVCRQCGLCHCPEGIDIPEVFACEGYFDRQMFRGEVNDTAQYALMERLRFWFGQKNRAKERYNKLAVKADACTSCGACLSQCPYNIDIPFKMHLTDYKLAGRETY